MPILLIFESVIIFIVAVVCVIRYQRLTFPFKILAWSVIIAFLLELLSKFFSLKYRNNAPILQIVCIANYLFYSSIYYYLFKNKVIKKVIFFSIIIVSVFFLINGLFFQPFNKVFPTNIYVPSQMLFAVFSLLLFKEMLMYPLTVNIIKQSVFWFNTAILFYATTMFFNLGLSNYLAENNLDDHFIFLFWYFITYVFYILICFAILTQNKKKVQL